MNFTLSLKNFFHVLIGSLPVIIFNKAGYKAASSIVATPLSLFARFSSFKTKKRDTHPIKTERQYSMLSVLYIWTIYKNQKIHYHTRLGHKSQTLPASDTTIACQTNFRFFVYFISLQSLSAVSQQILLPCVAIGPLDFASEQLFLSRESARLWNCGRFQLYQQIKFISLCVYPQYSR